MLDEILGTLSYIGDSIDKPGRAFRGLLAGRPDELAAAIPFSDSLGLSDQSRSTSGKDLLNALGVDVGDGLGGDLAGFATEVATDPLTWLGAGAGVRLGSAAEKAAVAAGPRWGTPIESLMKSAGPESTSGMLDEIMAAGVGRQVGNEIPTGSKFLGEGGEGIAFLAPGGDVFRIGKGGEMMPGRFKSDSVLPPHSTIDVPNPMAGQRLDSAYGDRSPSAFRVERLPFAENVGPSVAQGPGGLVDGVDLTYENAKHWMGRGPDMKSRIDHLDDALATDNLRFFDRYLGNVGEYRGRPVVIDPGAVKPIEAGQFIDYHDVSRRSEPGAAMSALLDALGSNATIQAGLDPRYRALLGVAGGGGGAVAGATGRAFGQ